MTLTGKKRKYIRWSLNIGNTALSRYYIFIITERWLNVFAVMMAAQLTKLFVCLDFCFYNKQSEFLFP